MFRTQVRTYLRVTKTSDSDFGLAFMKDRSFVTDVVRDEGRAPKVETLEKVLGMMDRWPKGPPKRLIDGNKSPAQAVASDA